MKINPKISVVTINFNNETGLQSTIESVVNQSYKNIEYLIIDGGSTDNSKTIIESYSDSISYWVSEPDKGIYNAMNKGIRAATGDFVIFINSGDTFTNTTVLETVHQKLTPEFDLYYGDYYRVKSNSKRRKQFPETLSFSFFYNASLAHPATFFRRTLFDEVFYYNENYKIVSDWEFYIYAICHKNVKYHYLKTPIADFDYTGISSNPKHKLLENEERDAVLKQHFPLFVADYEKLALLNSKRFQQFIHLQNKPILWKLLKAYTSFLLFFTSKPKL